VLSTFGTCPNPPHGGLPPFDNGKTSLLALLFGYDRNRFRAAMIDSKGGHAKQM
jgi:hypothetical protein